MNRRRFLTTLPAAAAAAYVMAPGDVLAQDWEFIRAWERAQLQRPREIGSRAVMAAPGEPGVRMQVHGRVFDRDGRRPAANVIVFAYHTDHRGDYDLPGKGPHSWRLRGWARTDAEGRFELDTIRPAPYPGRSIPAHIHLSLEGPNLQRRWVPEINFRGDPFLTPDAIAASKRADTYGSVRDVTMRDGVAHVDFNIRITDEGKF